MLGGDIRTKQSFGDFKLHVEFWLPNLPPDVTGQARANSGVYLQDRYELQVLDSFGDTTLANNECGGIYTSGRRTANAGDRAGDLADLRHHVPRGPVQRHHEDRERPGHGGLERRRPSTTTSRSTARPAAARPKARRAGPIRLQDHGDPGANVRYRNIWIEPM